MSFGNEDKLYQALGVRPGSISPLGLVFDENHEIHLIVDEMWPRHARLLRPPCRNTESLVISQEGSSENTEAHRPYPQYIQITGKCRRKNRRNEG